MQILRGLTAFRDGLPRAPSGHRSPTTKFREPDARASAGRWWSRFIDDLPSGSSCAAQSRTHAVTAMPLQMHQHRWQRQDRSAAGRGDQAPGRPGEHQQDALGCAPVGVAIPVKTAALHATRVAINSPSRRDWRHPSTMPATPWGFCQRSASDCASRSSSERIADTRRNSFGQQLDQCSTDALRLREISGATSAALDANCDRR